MAEERKQQEEALKRQGMHDVAAQLMQITATNPTPQNVVGLTSQVPGVTVEPDPEKQKQLDLLREQATKMAVNLMQGKEEPGAADVLAQLRKAFEPKLEEVEGKSYIQYGGTRVWLPGTSEEAAEAAARVQKILAESEARNKLAAENAEVDNQLARLFAGLPENKELKERFVSQFKTFRDVVSSYNDPMGKAAATLATVQQQLAEIEASPDKDDPYVKRYADYLKKQATAAQGVISAYTKADSAAARKQREDELAYAAAFELGKLILPVYKPEDVSKADNSVFVRNVFNMVYNSPEGQALAKRYGLSVLGKGLQIALQHYYNLNAGPQTTYALPPIPQGPRQ